MVYGSSARAPSERLVPVPPGSSVPTSPYSDHEPSTVSLKYTWSCWERYEGGGRGGEGLKDFVAMIMMLHGT